MHIFLDSSVLLSFCRSKKGASAFIIDYCIRGKLKCYISKKVVFEVQNNNIKDGNEQETLRFEAILSKNILTIVDDATEEEIKKAHDAFSNFKDEPIIAAAKRATRIQFVISFDKGFFKKGVIEYLKPIEVLKPGDFINKFRKELKTKI